MNLNVAPDLAKVIAAAKEANITIQDIQFIRDTDLDVLQALSILVEGSDDAKGYFTWLLSNAELKTQPLSF